ncbi:acyl-CoA dehydrogenase family protein [Halioxenophilus sp. WMMB6]|uniref:acyl-CoA dehydrogenase family protein n=1 Tax=Halioxenophilus sp. WMMB6 TaxID=3073815 RepID=UPI00295EB3AB|nr:acyl-CoA dehydrogenase family protein [Halioxenophilus sp. WMMB6]
MVNDIDLEAFRQEVKQFLADNARPEILEAGRKSTSAFAPFKEVMAWQKILADKGWAAPSWPKEYGGPGWNIFQRYIFSEECARARMPTLLPQNVQMIGPAIIGYGTAEQKAQYLPRILTGEDFWCQGYSEPGAGSDLASLKCKAEREGDEFVLNGSKTWTTYAHHANKMFALVRTDSTGKLQRGITFILLDMDSPGLEVRPMLGLDGEYEQCEVFFTDVRVPVANVIGQIDDGWSVAKYLLEFERGGSAYGAALVPAFERLLQVCNKADNRGRRAMDKPGVRRQMSDLYIQLRALEHTEKAVNSKLSHGDNPGPTASMLKILGTEVMQLFSEVQVRVAGFDALPLQTEALHVGSPVAEIGSGDFLTAMPYYLNSRAASIYAGTNEIQRSLLAKAILAQ